MLEYYVLTLCIISSLLVGALVVLQDIRSVRHRLYGLLTLIFVVLAVANTLSFTTSPWQAFYIQTVMATTSFGLYVMYLLVRTIRYPNKPWASLFLPTKWFALLTMVVLLLDYSPLVFSEILPGSPPRPIPNFGIALYVVQFLLLGLLGIYELYGGIRNVKVSKRVRLQSKYILIGLIPLVTIALVTGMVLPLAFEEARLVVLTPVYTLFFVCCVGYAIARHGLFDVRTAVVRTVAYTLAIGVLAGVYFGLAYVITQVFLQDGVLTGASANIVNIVLALVLALIFQPIKQFFDRVTNRIFFRSRYDIDELITKLGKLLTSTTDLRKLLSTTAAELQSALKATYVVFDVYRSGRQDVTVGQGRYAQFTEQETEAMYELANVLEDDLLVVGGAVDAEVDAMYGSLLRMLERRHVALVVPLGAHVGYLLLGDSLSGGYSQQDLKVLRAIGNELVIAIENAKSVQEVRELNTSLQQRIDRATRELRTSNEKLLRLDQTKDEFISMASHQLRTPLTSIKGYLSMVLEGDMGEVTDQQRKVLSEAYSSSERMVRLIGDFLNVSRLQTGKFVIEAQPADIVKLIDEEVDAMRRLAESHDMTLVYKRPRRFPVLNVDSDKLRQVIMNFIDNAIYYSRPHATIVVKAYVEHDDAIVEVHDQGIGVPEAEKEHLFTKFFRAENARRQRPDGTGVGLFLARKIVTAFDGEVIFNSREGRGSVFGFRLPIKKLEVKK